MNRSIGDSVLAASACFFWDLDCLLLCDGVVRIKLLRLNGVEFCATCYRTGPMGSVYGQGQSS